MPAAKLELIIGCMFSGKSSELIKRVRYHRSCDKRMVVVTHKSDVRYGKNKIISHNKDFEFALAVEKLADLDISMIRNVDVIIIDEAHFFDDLLIAVRQMVNEFNKHVIVAGLDGTFRQEGFKQVLELIPFADDVTRLTGTCAICANGTIAPFSKRITNHTQSILVGGSETYISVCRKHL